ncbi:hypothetical protein [Chitinophaga pinensis]|uniref:hypothetical protein n=1 Tax=Chitinophaga pinensis TaxID=79329 RepID=UPI00019E3491|nr:hypothetical protein [Chitinophaga pinensis]
MILRKKKSGLRKRIENDAESLKRNMQKAVDKGEMIDRMDKSLSHRLFDLSFIGLVSCRQGIRGGFRWCRGLAPVKYMIEHW